MRERILRIRTSSLREHRAGTSGWDDVQRQCLSCHVCEGSLDRSEELERESEQNSGIRNPPNWDIHPEGTARTREPFSPPGSQPLFLSGHQRHSCCSTAPCTSARTDLDLLSEPAPHGRVTASAQAAAVRSGASREPPYEDRSGRSRDVSLSPQGRSGGCTPRAVSAESALHHRMSQRA